MITVIILGFLATIGAITIMVTLLATWAYHSDKAQNYD